ncbi:MauE/DoxX family redox-associated membrane protein [Maridesulfovibrio hydrothermalis]|uniref:DoxX family protein n=1 Tax=Maridesulfovibrio hydrothermalis AM13 = DSM 14728 TaxID=1121451 RepID=L0REN0_9BACT|nr:MauE/DoxX family redox-associated membrane protein [Maridesulfovibrio hydrothermalis]CCO24667.1 DoxX family protein [Maridesulfovibrio hydrothermalis AM13 = DSM 14728]
MDFKSLPRIILGVIFIWACVDKIADPAAFAEIIKNYQILPELMIGPVAFFLPWLEFVCGAMLVCNVLTETATAILTAMLLVFIAALSANLYRGIDVACGCFSTDASDKSGMIETIARDVVMLLLAYLAIRFKRSELS